MKIPIISNLIEKRNFQNYVQSWLSGADISDTFIDAESATQLSAVFRCITLLAENTASMPLPIYRNTDKGREKVTDINAFRILNRLANPETTAMDFRMAMMWQACMYGSAYAEKTFTRSGEVAELWLIPTVRVKPVRVSGKLAYEIRMPNGKTQTWARERIFAMNWVSADSISGIKPLNVFRQVFETAINTQTYSNKYFKSAGAPSAAVTHKIKDRTELNTFKDDFKTAYAGKNGAHRIIFMQEGMEYKQISIPPNQGQMIESRKFNILEICRLYNIQPHKAMEMENTIKSNIEQSARDFINTTLLPWSVRWSQSVYRDLFSEDQQRQDFYAEMLFEAILRADIETRHKVYKTGIASGIYSLNEVRLKENMMLNPDPAADAYYLPTALININAMSTEQQQIFGAAVNAASKRATQKRVSGADLAKGLSSIASRSQPSFKSAGDRISKREANEVRKAAKRLLGTSQTQAFLDWVDEYFANAESWLKKSIQSEALTLAGITVDFTTRDTGYEKLTQEEINTEIDNYTTGFSERHSGARNGEIVKLVNENIQEENLEDIITDRADEWEEKGGSKIGLNEAVFVTSMISRLLFGSNGETELIFTNTSGKSCPFCTQINGQVVGIQEPIVPEGSFIQADDGSSMRIFGPKMHTPIHNGCQCQIVPR